MRNTLLASAALLGMAMALPAFAQTATDPNPANPSAIKDGTPAAGTGSGAAPGNDPATAGKTGATLGSRAPQIDPGPMGNTVNPAPSDSGGSGMSAPASGQSSGSMAAPSSGDSSQDTTTDTPAKPRHHRMSSRTESGGSDGHWAHQPGSGESGPASSQASNIDSADTHSAIAPHLPKPMVGENAGPDGYLKAADRALAAHKTGAAQQALEMAETRLLDRSTEAGSASQPDQNPRIAAVTAARKSLAAKDWQGARKSIQEAMNRGGDAESGGAMSGGSAMAAPPGASSGQMQNGMSSTSTDTSNVTVSAPDSGHNAADGHPGANPAPLAGNNGGSRGAAGVNAPGAPYAPNPANPGNEAK